MKKVLLVIMSVLCLGAVASMPVKAGEPSEKVENGAVESDETQSGQTENVKVEVSELNQIMTGQGKVEAKETTDSNSATVITYESGTPILVTGETENGWYRVSYQGKEGYVLKSRLTAQEFNMEELDKEMESAEAESRLVVEEVERYRAEARRSRIWGTVIVLLVIGIFATGIISTVKAEKEKKKDAGNSISEADDSKIDSLEVNTGEAETIIDLDKEE